MRRRPAIASILIAVTVVVPLQADSWENDWYGAATGLAWIINACEALHTVQIVCLPDRVSTPVQNHTDDIILAAIRSRDRPSMRQLFIQVSELVDFSVSTAVLLNTLAAMPNLVALNLTGVEVTGEARGARVALPVVRSMCAD